MGRSRLAAILLALAALAAGAWLWVSTQPGYGYALVQSYCLVAGASATVSGSDGATLTILILSRPLMWLFLGYAVGASVDCGRRALAISFCVLTGLAVACVVAPQTAGPSLLGLADASMLGGVAFVLPGALCAAAHLVTARMSAES